MKWAILAAVVAIALVAIVVLVRAVEPRLAFFPSSGEQVRPSAICPRCEGLSIETSDGVRLRAWWLPADDPIGCVLYFHGNGGNLSVWADILAPTRRRGLDVFAIDYRGYGLSSGSPTERGLYLDAEAAIRAFEQRIAGRRLPVVWWGRSLGTAVAAYAASKSPPDGLILEAGFPDARTLFRGNLVFSLLLPLSTYRFPTAEHLAHVTVPTLVLHGDRDTIIPYENGRALFERVQGPKRFFTVEGGGHNDLRPPDEAAYWDAVLSFVRGLEPKR